MYGGGGLGGEEQLSAPDSGLRANVAEATADSPAAAAPGDEQSV